MIDKINQFLKLKQELLNDHDILSVESKKGTLEVLLYSQYHFTGKDVAINERECDIFPYKISFKENGITFTKLLTQKDYEQFKKATAPTVAKKK